MQQPSTNVRVLYLKRCTKQCRNATNQCTHPFQHLLEVWPWLVGLFLQLPERPLALHAADDVASGSNQINIWTQLRIDGMVQAQPCTFSLLTGIYRMPQLPTVDQEHIIGRPHTQMLPQLRPQHTGTSTCAHKYSLHTSEFNAPTCRSKRRNSSRSSTGASARTRLLSSRLRRTSSPCDYV